jgi:hypothetical protein
LGLCLNRGCEVTFLPSANSQETRPISELSAATNRSDSNTVWAGYAASLKSVCDAGDLSAKSNKDAVVLVPFTATVSAATIQLQPNVCAKVRFRINLSYVGSPFSECCFGEEIFPNR